jgi:hypothetical protein
VDHIPTYYGKKCFAICCFDGRYPKCWSWHSTVIIVSDYRLDNWGSISSRGKNFSEAHPASYPMGSGGPFLGVIVIYSKFNESQYTGHTGVMLTTHPSSAKVKNE